MAVPRYRPIAEKAAPERTVTSISSGSFENVRPGIGPMTRRQIGRTNAAATTPCSTPETTFSIATSGVGIGASRRSSISFVNPKSAIIGSATD